MTHDREKQYDEREDSEIVSTLALLAYGVILLTHHLPHPDRQELL